ncbi:polar amino acid transport system substrate-binding protein [Pilibacter termitis]|uniref:Polar amino acid transport system substrate-binding protein n=1 Tax=Pilibacter termitis TaxID=263852 RepID=A0A1T4QCM3_9ENTE|nr:transporter substrate-binding domain-containing protein [Pilibacter termitis]SKA01492.1 polar amino acid transport system substrate-binding protein [Pilibacter termitis]
MKNNKWKTIIFLSGIVAVLSLITACGSKEEADTKETKTQEVLVGTGAYPKPYAYQEENGELKGFDLDALREIFKDSKEYSVEFQAVDFEAVLAGVDTGRFQIGANSFAKTKEREEKYVFSKPVYRNPLALVVKKGSKISSIEDIAGKKTQGEAAVSYTAILNGFNEEHKENPVAIEFTDKDLSQQFEDVASGKIDFKLESAIIASFVIKDHNIEGLEVIELPEEAVTTRSAYSYYIFPKNEEGETLVKYVNEQLETVRKDGRLKKLSEKYFSGDYVPNEEQFESK